MDVDIFLCRTVRRDTEIYASSCFLVPPALCLPERPVTNLYIRCSRCSTMLHASFIKPLFQNEGMQIQGCLSWAVFYCTEWMQVWTFFWVSAVRFCMWVVVPTIWSNPWRERLIQGSGNSAVTQTESLPAAKRSPCSVSAVIQVFIVKVGRTEDMRVCQMPIQEFESSKKKKKKKIHSDVRKCSVALLHLLKKQKQSNHYKDRTVQVAAGTSPPLHSGD